MIHDPVSVLGPLSVYPNTLSVRLLIMSIIPFMGSWTLYSLFYPVIPQGYK